MASSLGPSPQTVLLHLPPKNQYHRLALLLRPARPTTCVHRSPGLQSKAKAVPNLDPQSNAETFQTAPRHSTAPQSPLHASCLSPPLDTVAPTPSRKSVSPPDAGFPAPGNPPSPSPRAGATSGRVSTLMRHTILLRIAKEWKTFATASISISLTITSARRVNQVVVLFASSKTSSLSGDH